MKKLLVIAVCLAMSVASAAWEKIGSVQVADVDSLIKGVTKLGEFTGNQMLGMMAASSVGKLPFVELFGEGREGVPFSLSLFSNGETCEYAVLYPIDKSQQEFLNEHPGKVGKDGVIALEPKDVEVEDDDGEPGAKKAVTNDLRCVKFSKDGKWVALSDKPEQLDLALADVKFAQRSMNGDLVRLVVNKDGMKQIRKLVDESKSELCSKRALQMLRDCDSMLAGLVVDDSGLAVRGSVNAVKDSTLAKCGLKPLADKPLAFAGKEALVAYAIAADCGQASVDFKAICDLLAKYGIKLDFIALETKNGADCYTLDIPAAVSYVKSATNEFKKVDGKRLKADFEKLFVGVDAFKAENPAMAGQLAIKGFKTEVTPAERVKTVLPEIADKRPYSLQVGSIYAIVRAMLSQVFGSLEKSDRAAFEPILVALPPAGKGGIGIAQWSENDAHRFLFRISADEFKSVAAGFSGFAAYKMQQSMKQAKRRAPKATKSQIKKAKKEVK